MSIVKIKYSIAVAVGVMALSGSVHAGAVSSYVKGKDVYTTTGIASTTHLSAVQTKLTNDIIDAANQISSAVANQVANDGQLMTKEAQINEEVARGQLKAEVAARVSERYAPSSLGYNVCTRTSESTTNRDSKLKRRVISKQTQDELHNYNLAGKPKAVSAKAFVDRTYESEKGIEHIYANDLTLSEEEWEKGLEQIKNKVNPVPDPVLPEEAIGNSEQSGRYNALVSHKANELSLPERVMADIYAMEKPVISEDMTEVQTLTNLIGFPGGENPYSNEDGLISSRLYQELQIDSRHGNANWYESLLDMSEKGIAIEQAKMQALQLEMQSQQLDLLKKIALMQADDLSKRIHNELNPSINTLRSNIITSGTKDVANIE
jgi:hypothetical protein